MEAAKTEPQYWDTIHASSAVRMRLPVPLEVGVRNFSRLMRRYVRPGHRVLEVGFAPGKYLAWVAKRLGAEVAGVDYSPHGVETAQRLFGAVGIRGDLRCEDAFAMTFAPGSFDIVYSLGVIEHFDDPSDIIGRHVAMARPDGGLALLVIPNYGGIYGRLQASFDPENLAIHNTKIMSVKTLRRIGADDDRVSAEAFAYGRMTPALVSWSRRLPRVAATALTLTLNGVGLVQPFDVGVVSPWLVLALRRRR